MQLFLWIGCPATIVVAIELPYTHLVATLFDMYVFSQMIVSPLPYNILALYNKKTS